MNTKREAEMQRGALQVKRDMLQGLIDLIRKELDPKFKYTFSLLTCGNDPRQWGVKVDFNNGVEHSENVFDFPTDALKAKIMLML